MTKSKGNEQDKEIKEGRGHYKKHPQCKVCAKKVANYFYEHNIKANEIYKQTGIKLSTVKNLLNQSSDSVSLSTIYYVSEAYGVSPTYFICDSPTDYQQAFLDNMGWLTRDASPQSLDRITQIVKLIIEEQAQN